MKNVFGAVGLALLSIGILPGCLVPYVIPPLRVQVLGGTSVAQPLDRSSESKSETDPYQPLMTLRSGVFPLGFFASMLERNFDVGTGYVSHLFFMPSDENNSENIAHGFFLEGHYWFLTHRDGPLLWRLGLLADVDILSSKSQIEKGFDGFGFFWGVGFELAHAGGALIDEEQAASSTEEDGEYFFSGEGGFGVVLGASYLHVDGQPEWTLSAGLNMRIPATVGFLLVPLIY